MSQNSMFPSYPDAVTVTQLCEMLCIGHNTAYNLLRSGRLKSVQIGGKYVIPTVWIEEYMNRQRP